MNDKKFIAISEDEYNSFKHGEYEREINNLKEEIEKLKKEKEEALMAKGTIVKISEGFCGTKEIKSFKIITDENFESEILNAIKNTIFAHAIEHYFPDWLSDEPSEYVLVGDTYYYKNKWYEKLKEEIENLSKEVKILENKRNSLQEEIDILNANPEINQLDDGCHLDRDSTILKKIINKFTKNE